MGRKINQYYRTSEPTQRTYCKQKYLPLRAGTAHKTNKTTSKTLGGKLQQRCD